MSDDTQCDLVELHVGHQVGKSVERVAFKSGANQLNYDYKFAELLSDRLSRDLIARAMTGHVNDYEL
jgi:LysR family cys regulon transcriptional activator